MKDVKANKSDFLNLLHRAIKLEPKEAETSKTKTHDGCIEKQTRSNKTVGTSEKQRGVSQK